MRNHTTTDVPAAAITQKAIGTCSRFLQTPNTAVNTGRMAQTVAAWLAGTLCSAIVVKIGKANTIPTAARPNRRTCRPAGNGYFPSRAQTNAIVPAPAPLANAINQGSNPRKASRALTNDRLKQSTPRNVEIHPSSSPFESEDKSCLVRSLATRRDERIPSMPPNLAQITQPEQI